MNQLSLFDDFSTPPFEPKWIPALVKYQNPTPSWWRNEEAKAKCMGQVILVKRCCFPQSENGLCPDPNGYTFRSKTPDNGNWFWGKDDLLLWPTEDDVTLANSVQSCCATYKRRPLV